MGVLSIAELEPDMVVAADLKDRSGRLLISKGTVLTHKYIKICQMWGVIEANIEGFSDEDAKTNAMKQLDPSAIAVAEEAVRKRFSHNDMDHPMIRELFRLCTLREMEGKAPDLEQMGKIPHVSRPDPLKGKAASIKKLVDAGLKIPQRGYHFKRIDSRSFNLFQITDAIFEIGYVVSFFAHGCHQSKWIQI